MTNKQKIKILKKMRFKIKNRETFCLCEAYKMTVGDYPEDDEALLNLGIKKPDTPRGVFWWEYPNNKPRYRAIDKAIEKLEKEIK